MSAKKSPVSISALGPAQRVHVATEVKENTPASKSRTPNLKSTPSSSSSRSKPVRRGVKLAQEEALRAFGGKSLGNVLTDAQDNSSGFEQKNAVSADASRPLSRKEKRELEALEAFRGADLAQITNEVKQKLEDASAKHLQLVEQSSKEILRKKLDLPREDVKNKPTNGWDKDFSEVDFKPGLSRVERDRLEYLASKASAAPQEKKTAKHHTDAVWGESDLADVVFKPGLSKVERERAEYLASKQRHGNAPAGEVKQQRQQKTADTNFAGDLAELDVKPALSKMEKERMDFLAAKQQQQQQHGQPPQKQLQSRPAQNFAAAAAEEEAARAKREQDRLARAEARKQADLAQKERVRLAKEQRDNAKLAPFMQRNATGEKKEHHVEKVAEAVALEPITPVAESTQASDSVVEPAPSVESAPLVVEPVPSSSSPSVSISQAEPAISPVPCVESAPVVVESVPSSSSPSVTVAQAEPAVSPIAAAFNDNDDMDDNCLTPGKCFRTAVNSLVNSPADSFGMDESMGELLEQISMSNLSDELTPNSSATGASEEDVIEIQSSLQKRKTPIVRQPYYDAPEVNDQLREALNEIVQQNENREEALIASMRDSLNSLTVKQLKDELKERNLKVSGLKAELVERLIEHRKENASSDNGKCLVM